MLAASCDGKINSHAARLRVFEHKWKIRQQTGSDDMRVRASHALTQKMITQTAWKNIHLRAVRDGEIYMYIFSFLSATERTELLRSRRGEGRGGGIGQNSRAPSGFAELNDL